MPSWGIDEEFTDTATTDAKAPERELVPEGDHEFTVKAVIDSPERVEIRLAHDDRRFGWVFARMPKTANWAKRILSTFRTSLGITREAWAGTTLKDFEGLRVKARVYHKAGTSGGTFVNVAEFLPGAGAAPVETATAKPAVERAVAPPSSRPPANRTPTKKADAAAAMPEDDIPF
jgi:hypothetical protein